MTAKRWRTPNARPGELKIAYGKERNDTPELMFCWGGGGASKRDSNMLLHFFYSPVLPENGRCLVAELAARGYDLTTLKFSVKKSEIKDKP